MIIDSLTNIGRYTVLHPLFSQVIDFLRNTDWKEHATGRLVLKENELMVNFDEALPKNINEARLETHDKFIDIQIPVSGTEFMGYAPRTSLSNTEYDSDRDISFYDDPVETYLTVKPGMFVIFFPDDAHAPAITPKTLRKVVIKVKYKS